MDLRNHILRIHLPGGLGNQLFTYFAAISLSNRIPLNIEIDLDSADMLRTNNLYSIKSFNVMFPIRKMPSQTRVAQLKRLTMIRLRRRSKIFNSLVAYQYGELFEHNTKNIEDLELQLKSKLRRRWPKNINLHGYFQDCGEILKIEENKRFLILQNRSIEFENLSFRARISEPIMIHCRLGDYASGINRQKIGVLSSQYFRNCLELLPERLAAKEIWLFSDDVKYARELYSSINSRINFIEINGDPAETLMLFTQSSALICANSTFSLVSGLINPSERLIFYPKPWTKSGIHIQDSCPSNWTAVGATWL